MDDPSDRTAADAGRLTLDKQGWRGVGVQHWNASQAVLAEHALSRGEGELSDQGALVFKTGKYTGRSPKDKFIVREPSSESEVDWGEVNFPFEPDRFDALHRRVLEHFEGREVWIQDSFGGTDPTHRLPIRVICERAYHALFAHQLFVRPTAEELASHRPAFTIIAAPDFQAVPERDGTRSEVFIVLNFAKRLVLIGGTQYAGEIKKSVFSILNYLLPRQGVLSMHCSANVGEAGDVALFFGLSGTGKTTLSADPIRALIGDDEHGWGDDGVFNFEGGCYAKCIRLDRLNEPEIYEAIRFGTVLENVVLDPKTRVPDFADASLTENTRAAYPIESIPNHVPGGQGGHPSRIIFLTCDAFGVLPPLSRLTPEQAMYHFLSGYTAKVAGTERGLSQEPSAVFSACFGAPFMTLPPNRYADLLGTKMRRHHVEAWLLNTGWTGGGHGQGRRIALRHTRALVDAVLGGTIRDASYAVDPIFGLEYPKTCPGVLTEILDPRTAWPDPTAYDTQASRLAQLFRKNFTRFNDVELAIQAAGPREI
ncbi:phosphoenolpyruvate carboxykinase (ATP) [Singulisphaera acidiphila]|uniref:Phosphoenolpyruvate carboxykinase (ATP) n=1 Tax=Singulisphaera acidiphila (strain ATCC BAA-1392 / DSM 18658 / VKM B-2454 / MOB10) TaxID=886293 RepID=L0DMR5_SINAD|nr:phosphoenolpyruvate carboxykinase (ATP) [Singulisphaera acidiphila]AGA30674.1 ATP-dependent phosphoenolpyruvate carboxykinase [Singulisphaera acidiphila DSM 18658]